MLLLRSSALAFLLESHLTRRRASGWSCRECRARHEYEQRRSKSRQTFASATFKLRALSLPYRPQHHFSTTAQVSLEDHYATLDVSPSASQEEIKKAFYTLSKTHHPDRNPQNQEEASKKFVAMSDAYAVLGDPTKRQKYDRERQPASARGVGGYPQGSYSSSSSQAGGRPASGLSRRRGQFRGPPPSFYRSGGWGTNSEKRRANAAGGGGGGGAGQNQAGDSSTGFDESFARQQQGGGAGAHGAATDGAQDADDWPFSAPNDVPHFNRGQHYRRTTAVDEQLRRGRTKRRKILLDEQAEQRAVDQIGAGTEFRSFALISGVILLGVGVPLVFMGRGANGKASNRSKAA